MTKSTEPTENTEDTNPPAEEPSAANGPENDAQQQAGELEEAQRKVAEYHEKMVRMQADMENLRKRTQRDLSNAHKYAVEQFASGLLPVKDNLEMGLEVYSEDVTKLREGIELTLEAMAVVLQKFAVKEIDPGGETFDPNFHEAVTTQESAEHEPNTIIKVIRKGYTLHDRLLRSAMVIVARAPEETAE